MAEEKYYRLGLLKKINSGAEWEYIYFKAYENNRLRIIHKETKSSHTLNVRLEEITKEKMDEIIRESGRDRSYG